jgi:hypothetical protein
MDKLIMGNRVRTQVELSKDIQSEYYFLENDNLTGILTKELIQRFTNELISTRMKDVVIEENPNSYSTQYKLDLFVFNYDELMDLIKQHVREAYIEGQDDILKDCKCNIMHNYNSLDYYKKKYGEQ